MPKYVPCNISYHGHSLVKALIKDIVYSTVISVEDFHNTGFPV